MKSTTILLLTAVMFFLFSSLIIWYGPEVILLNRMQKLKDYSDAGDAFGGSLGPLVALLGAAVTFLAFWVQYRANEIQKRAIADQQDTVRRQEKDLARERFESRFYKQIEILKFNVTEVQVGKSTNGRKAFRSFFNELKFIYHVVKNHYELKFHPTFREEISEEGIYNVAYLIFFFGIGPNSTLLVRSFLSGTLLNFFENAVTDVESHQSLWQTERQHGRLIAVSAGASFFSLDLKYKPGNGHTSILSHYIRHLFQTVKFVDQTSEEIISKAMKYDYISTLRSQLSPHEQLFIFYNAISILGKPWIDNPNLIKRYCLIKSSLLPLADFYKTPADILGSVNEDGRPLFEWDEIGKRLEAL